IKEIEKLYKLHEILQDKNYTYLLADIKKLIDDDTIEPSAMYQKTTYFIEQLKENIYHIGFRSKLLLESDSDKYFLTDTLLRHLPNLMEIVGQIRSKTTRAIVENSTTLDVKYSLQNSCMLCKEYQDLVARTIKDLSDQDKKVRLLAMLEAVDTQTKRMQEFVKYTVVSDDIQGLDPYEFFAQATTTVEKIYELYKLNSEFLSQNLELKLKNLEKQKFYGVLVGALIVLIIITIIISTIRSYMLYMQSESKIKNNLTAILQLKSDLEKCDTIEEISSKALYFFSQKFEIVNGSIYLFNEENSKLYMTSSFATDKMKPIVELGEGLIGEVAIQKKHIHTELRPSSASTFKVEDIVVAPSHICTLPLISYERLFGVLQVGLLKNGDIVHNDDFSYYIDMIIGFLRDTKNLERSKRYIELIDEYVITSKSNKDGIIVDVSKAFCKISGYKKEELIGKTHSIVSHPDTPDEFYTQMWQTISKGSIFRGEVKNLDKNRNPYWIYLTITPQLDVHGNVLGYSSIFQDITDKKRIEHYSITDALTQLYNRRFFDENFDKELRIARRDKKALALFVIDIDFFKQYNDTYGHIKGDEALKKVAQVMGELFKRANDYVYRIGGEEFAVTFSSISAQSVVKRAELLRQSVLDLALEHKHSASSNGILSISIGAAFIPPECSMEAMEIYKLSDQALYSAKKEGRNRVKLANFN
ncbi:MAG: diguanylate cyclase, partial [Sulfurimonas sp.]